ncbi:MAG: DeoR/GlpR family DNA-binding transcription regulator [Spirochaetia bacterium]|jgi:DeoR family deoxyribose operon repressor
MAKIEEKKEHWKSVVQLLSQNGDMSVKEIARFLDVSEITTRRYLMQMEKERLIDRTHGGARLFDSSRMVIERYTIGEHSEQSARQKSLIGLKAASLVQPNETIFLDSGSTTPYVAKYLDKDLPLTVVCYTFLNALEFYNRKNTNLILLGGFYDRDSTIFHGSQDSSFLRGMRADRAFISAAGIDARLGLTTFFYFEADIKKMMVQSAKQVILVADSSKFGKTSVSHFADLSQVHVVITDQGVRSEDAVMLRDRGIQLIIAG